MTTHALDANARLDLDRHVDDHPVHEATATRPEAPAVLLARQRAAFLRDGAPSLAERRASLTKLRAAVLERKADLEAALAADFGHRSRHETAIMEILALTWGIDYLRKNLRRFMRRERRRVALPMRFARAHVEYQPLGVIGIVAPWNYPLSLALMPLATALAAGNRAMIKPSELTPATSEALVALVAQTFAEDEATVVTGDATIGAAFAALPFDHLFFTGSTAVGRAVMRAASEHLVPVTLELGGKSPVLVDREQPLDRVAADIAYGKLANAGQTCVAPDYVLLHEGDVDRFVEAWGKAVASLYPEGPASEDYTSIVNVRHYDRLRGLLGDARAKGARLFETGPSPEQAKGRAHTLPPTLVFNVHDDMRIMQEEIFGPVLPIVTYRDLAEAIAFVNARPRPLALYYFGSSAANRRQVLTRTTSGGVTINGTLMHYVQDDLPFGGVGASGLGAYHGFEGFRTFSHQKAVFDVGRWNGGALLRPPFGRLTDIILNWMLRQVSPGSRPPIVVRNEDVRRPDSSRRSLATNKETIMNPTTEVIPSADSTGAPYIAGNFAPLRSEVTSFDLEVIGHVPEELTGRFLRIGPNPIDELDRVRLVRHHWFAGTGMAHGLRLRGGKAEWFRSRFVLDRDAARVLSRKPIPGPAEGSRDGNVNTNLMNVGGKLCAVVEAGSIPVELDYELASVRRTDFDGTLEAGFTGHPKFDPITGEHHALAYEPFQPVRYISVDRDGRATTRARIDLPHIPLIHDMAFTQSFIIVPDFPVTFQPELSHTDFPWLWDERRDCRIGLLPRNGDVSRIQWFEAPRCFAFHFANAYDDGDLTIIDLPKHPRMFLTDQNGPNEGAPILVRWTLHRPSGRLTETVIDDRGDEFPRINGRYGGQAYRYVYSAHWGNDVAFGPAMKHDMQRQTTEIHDYGRGRMTAEPVFVRKPGAAAEDEGWVLSYVYDPQRDLSDVVILDAQDFAGEPIATIRLPVRVPFGFHGGWAPDRITVVE